MDVGRGKAVQTIVSTGRNVPPRVRRQQLLGLQWDEWSSVPETDYVNFGI